MKTTITRKLDSVEETFTFEFEKDDLDCIIKIIKEVTATVEDDHTDIKVTPFIEKDKAEDYFERLKKEMDSWKHEPVSPLPTTPWWINPIRYTPSTQPYFSPTPITCLLSEMETSKHVAINSDPSDGPGGFGCGVNCGR